MSEPEILGPGDFYEEPRQGMGPLARMLAIGAITVGSVALAAVVWFAYQQGIRSGAEEAAPVITASEDPIKREPADRGGLDVPDQDKLVFGRLAPGQIQEPVERLLPPPEEPAERAPSPVIEAAPAETPADTPAPPAEVFEQMAAAPPAEPVTEPPAATAPPPPSPPAAVVTAPPPPPPPPPVVVAQSIKLDRGTFFRIQAGPLTGRAVASSLCGKLKSRNQDCLVVAP